MVVPKFLKANMRNSLKVRKEPSAKLKIFILAVITTVMLTASVCSTKIIRLPKTTTTPTPLWRHEKCAMMPGPVSFGGFGTLNCSSCYGIPTNILRPENVEVLDMNTGNTISTLKNGSLIRSKLISLKVLKLKHCGIRIVEQGALSGSNLLTVIYLSDNLITALNPEIFEDVPSVRALYINNNPIHKIQPSKAFPSSKELTTLDLSNCKLSAMPANIFDNLYSLRMLNLSGNNFKHLDWKVFQKTNHFVVVSLKGNPWHCDCHVKFLMETLKKKSFKKLTNNITCASAEIPIWKGHLLSQVPEKDLTCHPEVNLLVYSSYSPLQQPTENGDWYRQDGNQTLELGDDVYFKCEYSGYPKPEVQWFKDNQLLIGNMSEPANLGDMQRKTEFRNDSSSTLKRLEQDQEIFRYKFKDVLAVHRIQVKDIGSYTCTVNHNHMTSYKTVTLPEIKIPNGEEKETILAVWVWIFLGVSLAILIAVITVIAWLRRGKGEKRGIIEEPIINLGEFDVKQSIPDLMSMLEYNTDTSLI